MEGDQPAAGEEDQEIRRMLSGQPGEEVRRSGGARKTGSPQNGARQIGAARPARWHGLPASLAVRPARQHGLPAIPAAKLGGATRCGASGGDVGESRWLEGDQAGAIKTAGSAREKK